MKQKHLLVLLLLSPFDHSLCFGDSLALPHATISHSTLPSLSSSSPSACSRCPASTGAILAAAAADARPPSARTRSATGARRAAPALMASAAASPDGKGGRLGQWLVANRSILLLLCLIVHKCSTDGLTRYTRLAGDYSGSTVAVMSEIMKFPLIATAIASFGGGAKEIMPTFRAAVTSTPFSNCGIALCYTFNNLLYFDALGALSAVAYQVLSQSKTLFTAGLMYIIVGKRLIFRQVVAIFMLIAGALLVQFQELARSNAATSAASAAAAATGPLGMPIVYWGAALTLFSSFISALPNVAYEKVLKTEGENQWVNNIQVTVWIMLWISAANYGWPIFLRLLSGDAAGAAAAGFSIPTLASITGLPDAIRGAFRGFTPAVWGVCILKALNGILIPATFKYADNILYAYAKPSSIVVMTVISCLVAGALPSPSLVLGVAAVVGSIFLYSSKPKSKTA